MNQPDEENLWSTSCEHHYPGLIRDNMDHESATERVMRWIRTYLFWLSILVAVLLIAAAWGRL